MTRGKRLRRTILRRVRTATVKKHQSRAYRGKREQQGDTAYSGYWRAVVCGILFVALITLKLIMPGNLSTVRETLAQWLVRDADFEEAFSAVGRAMSGEDGIAESLSDAYIAVFGGEDEAKEVSGNLIGVEVPEEKAAKLLTQRELPASAVAEQRILGFAYAAPLAGEMTSPFGWREHPTTGCEVFHYGVDLAAEEGAEVACFADGTVGVVGSHVELGKYVTVNHVDGFSTLYAHCSTVCVKSGETVEKGEKIACVGSTGNATGAHLHFEIHDGKEYLNPVYYLDS